MKPFRIFQLLIILTVFTISACHVNRKLESIKTGVGDMGELTGQKFAKGLLAGFLQDSAQKILNHKLDSIMNNIDGHLKYTSQGLRDTMLGEYTSIWMQKRLLDIESTMADARTELLGSKTKYLMAGLRNELLGDATVAKLANMRNELLGSKTDVLLDSIIQNAIVSFTTGYKNNIKPELASTVSNTLDSANGTISKLKGFAWALGGIVAGLMILGGFIFRRYRQHRELVKVLTKEIDVIPDRMIYDQVVTAIKNEARSKGINDKLEEILVEQNLREKSIWKQKNSLKEEKVKHLLGDFLNKCKNLQNTENINLVNELRREAVKQNIEQEVENIMSGQASKKVKAKSSKDLN
jgi:hypothetical protein